MSGQTFRPVTSDKQRCEPWNAGRPPLKDNRGRTIRSEKTRTSGRRNTRHETRHPICRVSQSHPITKTHRHLPCQLAVVSPQVSYSLKEDRGWVSGQWGCNNHTGRGSGCSRWMSQRVRRRIICGSRQISCASRAARRRCGFAYCIQHRQGAPTHATHGQPWHAGMLRSEPWDHAAGQTLRRESTLQPVHKHHATRRRCDGRRAPSAADVAW